MSKNFRVCLLRTKLYVSDTGWFFYYIYHMINSLPSKLIICIALLLTAFGCVPYNYNVRVPVKHSPKYALESPVQYIGA
jgi:hypothetical protein